MSLDTAPPPPAEDMADAPAAAAAPQLPLQPPAAADGTRPAVADVAPAAAVGVAVADIARGGSGAPAAGTIAPVPMTLTSPRSL
eukprot:2941350-Lingulodinium_polyedra.AAC.1